MAWNAVKRTKWYKTLSDRIAKVLGNDNNDFYHMGGGLGDYGLPL
jgi:hypothetical protein